MVFSGCSFLNVVLAGTCTHEDVDAHEGNQGFIARLIIRVCCPNTGDNELRDGHADRAEEEERASAPFLDEV